MRNPRGTQLATSLTAADGAYSDSFADKLHRFGLDAKLDVSEALVLLNEAEVDLTPADRVKVAALIAGVSQRAFAKSRLASSRWNRTAGDPLVYFIRCGAHVKIGTTTHSIKERLAGMQLPPNAELVAVIPDAGRAEERDLHRRFAADRVSGEWFNLSPELKSLIETFGVSEA